MFNAFRGSIITLKIFNKLRIKDLLRIRALYLGEIIGFDKDYQPHIIDYLKRMKARPAFQKAVIIGEADSNFKKVDNFNA